MKKKFALLLIAFAAACTAAHAQSGRWPNKPVRVIVPFPAGGVVDLVGRLLAARLSEEFREQFIVDNRGGAGSQIGTEIAVRANPDGYTIILVPTSYATNAALYKLPYDPNKAFAPISLVTIGPLVLVVHPSVKANTLKEFIDLARAKPGALNFGSQGTGSAGHFVISLFQQMSGIELVHVPYKGDAPAMIDLVAGQVQAYFGGPLVTLPHINAGRVRGLAVTTAKRSRALPDLPAVSEQLPGFAVPMWYGVLSPAGTPREIVTQLNQAIARIVKNPDVQQRLLNEGMEIAPSTPQEFASLIANEVARFTKVVKTANFKVD